MAFSADETFRNALASLQAGKTDDAERLFKKLLSVQPRHVAGLNLFGILLTKLGRFGEAERYMREALNENATSDVTFYNYGIILKSLKRPAEALERFSQALAINAAVAETWNNRGTVFKDLNRYTEAVADFDKAISINPNYADAHCNKGQALAKLELYDQSFAAFSQALLLKPDFAEAWLGRGNVIFKRSQWVDALAAYDRTLILNPDLPEAWLGRGNVFNELKRYDEARVAYDGALTLNSDLAEAWLGRGNLNFKLCQYDTALAAYDRALALNPNFPEAWLGRGNVYNDLNRYDEARTAYDRALAIKSDLAGAWLGRANLFFKLSRYDEALAAYDRTLTLKSDLPEAGVGRAHVLFKFNRHEDALAAYDSALKIDPDIKYAMGRRLHARQFICDWTGLDEEVSDLLRAVREGKPASVSFPLLAIASSPNDQLLCARRFIADQPSFPKQWTGGNYSHRRLRVAYLSPDLCDHAVAYLTAGLFEQHDKSRLELTAISLGPDQDSDIRRRIRNSFEHFVDAQSMSDQAIAELMRRSEIDIAVDLSGFTEGARPNILARRPAPVQATYLGYAGTTGADYIDYIIADQTVIPADQCTFFSEQVVWLPDSYLINDSQRRISERTPTRGECGLPENGFVFCCFNNTYKLGPDTFSIWMRLLNAVEGSVIWLSDANSTAKANLRREAEKRGVAEDRLIFAPKLPVIEDHLARQRQADLFLDTLPYNAHTTAADALWAGLPVLTCLGATFAGRVAASLLKAVGLDELVTTSLEDYEALALKLAKDRPMLASLREKLARHRGTYPLFDTKRFARHLEAAYTMMWERQQRGETLRRGIPLLADGR